jgi:signal transduction histidine kinase/ActR/RegA family two-component response regulator
MQLPLETIINSLEDAVVCVNERRDVAFLNAAASKLFACEGQRVIGQPFSKFPGMLAILGQLNFNEMHLSADSPKGARRLQGQTTKGEPFCLEALVTRVTAGGQGFFIVDIRDISLQQQMEKAFYQSRKSQAISALTSGIAHDFKNVLTGISSQLELALASPELPVSLKENLTQARTSAYRGTELVNKLQGFSRNGKAKLTPMALPDLVETAVATLRRDLDQADVRYNPAPQPPWTINADATQLLQVIVNLGLTLRDSTPEDGELRLELSNLTLNANEARAPRKTGDFVRLTVSYSELGLPAEMLSDLFETSFLNKNPGNRLALALAAASSVVAEHGGWMEGESHPSQGSQFHLLLPRTVEPIAAPPRQSAPAGDAASLRGKERILVVDDEPLVRMVIRAVLAYRGYCITEASHAEEALGKYVQTPGQYDLVLMDLYMPGMNGRDALLQLRRHDPSAKAILLSASLPDTENVSELEGITCLQKPFENQDLVRLVRQTLDASSN